MAFKKLSQALVLSAGFVVSVAGFGVSAPRAADTAADAAQGKALFDAKCAICHTTAEGQASMMAPNLFGLVGRDVAGADGYSYSAALADVHEVWSEDTLDSFLKAPGTDAPGTRMLVAVPDDQERAAIIAYLKTLN